MNNLGYNGMRTAIIIGSAFTLFYWGTTSGLPLNSDGRLIASVAARIATGQSPSFDGPVYLMILSGVPEDNGTPRFFSKYPIGQSLLEIPFILIGGLSKSGEPGSSHWDRMMLYLLPAIMGGLVTGLLFLLLRSLSINHRAALVTTILCGTSTIMWPYARTLYTEVTQAAFLLTALYAFLCARQNTAREILWLWIGSIALGILILVRPTTVLFIPAVVGFYCWGKRISEIRVHKFFALIVPIISGITITCWYNLYRFGSILNFGYTGGKDGEFGFDLALLPEGVYGLLLSPGKGIIWYTPLLVLAIWGWPKFLREHTRISLTIILIFTTQLLFHGAWWAWHGDWSWGPRFLVPIIPLAMLPLGYVAEDVLSNLTKWKSAIVILTVAVSFSVQVLGNFFPYPAYNAFLIEKIIPNLETTGNSLRDNMEPAHFTWEFSPLSGNLWLFRVKFLGADPKTTCPWRNTGSPVPQIHKNTIPIDFWAWRFQYENEMSAKH